MFNPHVRTWYHVGVIQPEGQSTISHPVLNSAQTMFEGRAKVTPNPFYNDYCTDMRSNFTAYCCCGFDILFRGSMIACLPLHLKCGLSSIH